MIKWIVALFLFVSPAHANDWTTTDSVMLGANVVGYALDARLTMNMVAERNPDGSQKYHEENYFLGDDPDHQAIRNYFTKVVLIHAGVSYILPPKYRALFQTGALVVSIGVIDRNASMGVRFNF